MYVTPRDPNKSSAAECSKVEEMRGRSTSYPRFILDRLTEK